MSNSLGRYEVLKILGRGAMGVVYKAKDPLLNRIVAIKTMSGETLESQDLHRRLEREAAAAAKLDHPNIVTVHDFGKHRGVPFIAMEYLEGYDLKTVIRKKVPLNPQSILGILRQIARGMRHAHRAGVVHRDIKPANIRILKDGRVKIMDFGIAHLASSEMTGAGTILGSIAYMSPEQIEGQPVNHRCDVFSFGVLAYELLARRLPFDGENIPATLNNILNHEPTPLPEGRLEPFPALGELIKKCLVKTPDDRFNDFDEIAYGLEEIYRELDPAAEITEITDSDLGERDENKKTVLLSTMERELAKQAQPSDEFDLRELEEEALERVAGGHSVAVPAWGKAPGFFDTQRGEGGSRSRTKLIVAAAIAVFVLTGLVRVLNDSDASRAGSSTSASVETENVARTAAMVDASDSLLDEAQARLNNGDYRGAVTVLEQRLSHAPDDEVTRHRLAAAQSELEREFSSRLKRATFQLEGLDLAGASRELASALALRPGESRARDLVGRVRQLMHPNYDDREIAGVLVAREIEHASKAMDEGRRADALDALTRARVVRFDVPEVSAVLEEFGFSDADLGIEGIETNFWTRVDARFDSNVGVEIYIDGRLLGTVESAAGLSERIPVGAHRFRYQLPDYMSFEEDVVVDVTSPAQFRHRFPRPGALIIRSEPRGHVQIDGESHGMTPVRIDKFAEGEHSVTVTRDGHGREFRKVVVKPSQTNIFSFVLQPGV